MGGQIGLLESAGHPLRIDSTHQKTLPNMRAWAMLPSRDPGQLCTVGLTASNGRESIYYEQLGAYLEDKQRTTGRGPSAH